MLEWIHAITNKVLELITFVLAYPTVYGRQGCTWDEGLNFASIYISEIALVMILDAASLHQKCFSCHTNVVNALGTWFYHSGCDITNIYIHLFLFFHSSLTLWHLNKLPVHYARDWDWNGPSICVHVIGQPLLIHQLSQHYTAGLLQSSLGMKGLKGTWYLSKHTKALFYALVVFLTKWVSINDIPIRNNGTVGCLRQSSHLQPLHIGII